MAVVSLGFHHPGTGALIGTLTDADCIEIEFRPALHELGAIKIVVSRHLAAASTALLKSGNLIAVTVPQVSAQPIWGAVLKDDAAQLIDKLEQGGEHITLTGPGLLEVLRHGRLQEETYAPVPPASEERGSSQVGGVWFWQSQPYGAIYSRAIEEGQYQPGTPLGLVDKDFGRVNDSDGVPWDTIQEDYQLRTGTDLLTVSDTLAQAGDFYPVAVPVVTAGNMRIALSAYQDVGRNLNGAFGAGTVRFEKGTNILTELQRKRKHTRLTHLLTRDMDGTHALHITPAAYDAAVVGYLDVGQTNDAAHIAKIAQTVLAASDTDAEEFTLEVTPGITPASGEYLPGPIGTSGHFWPGDRVTLHTGSGEHDLNNSTQRVVAVSVVLDMASKETDATAKARSLRIVPELSFRNTRGMAGNNPPVAENASPGCCIRLCGPTIPGTGSTTLFEALTWSEPQNVTVNTYEQTIPAFTIDGALQPSHVIGNGYNHHESYYRNHPSGTTGVPAASKFFPTDGSTPIALGMDIREQASAGTNASVRVEWYATGLSTVIQTDTVFAEQPLSGWQSFAATLTPPAGAVAWRLLGLGRWDNIAADTGSGTPATNPRSGTSNEAARCDHTHEADEHNHDLVYAHAVHDHSADGVEYDNAASGLTAVDVQAAIDEVASGSAGHPDLAAHDSLGLATQAELDAHAADTGLHGGGGGGGAPAWAGPDPATATAVTPTGSAVWTKSGSVLSVRFAAQVANDVACLLIPTEGATQIVVRARWIGQGNFIMHGPLFADGTTDAANAVWLMNNGNTNATHFRSGTITNLASSAATGGQFQGILSGPVYYRLTLVSANTWRMEASPDGVSWSNLNTADTAMTLTPTHMGVGVSSWGNTATNFRAASFDFWVAS